MAEEVVRIEVTTHGDRDRVYAVGFCDPMGWRKGCPKPMREGCSGGLHRWDTRDPPPGTPCRCGERSVPRTLWQCVVLFVYTYW